MAHAGSLAASELLHGCNFRGAVPFTHAGPCSKPVSATRQLHVRCNAQGDVSVSRRAVLGSGVAATIATQLQTPSTALANKVVSDEWEAVDLPVDPEVVLLDIGFTGADAKHGFLLGTRQTLLETFDGGKTWTKRTVAAAQDEGFNYRFTSVDFNGNEGWIIGKPAVLLHTTDGGTNWERVPLSSKLPGSPVLIKAVGAGAAEMTTDQGAIYVTENGASTWQAAVQESVDATLNRTVSSGISGASYYEGTFSTVKRSGGGDYVAVSSRGNFYMTWQPGQSFWQPHNRPGARRIQNMGWTGDDTLWLATRGGDVYLGADPGVQDNFNPAKIGSRGFGILDVGFRTAEDGYACGGSGSLFKSSDGGKTWKRDRNTDQVAGNLYEIKFFSPETGFILGNSGILLRYIGSGSA